ncbi:hypothetical protein MNR01_01910 [Lysobacter sp. S4-A87]|uniref:DUF6868 family protein n=1 Tax=Lysobacter sp. S4-A87 TaxID=2925843 RepID=UPI001F535E54|nr:hypothetical protein [Lysobacter sp. S4-A87]UNK49816.1 hypothetical protein MNR01_01910 [Lysobacter sp. S4-A87]
MAMNEIKDFLLWCACINYAVLLVWFILYVLARDWLYSMHGRWFRLSVEGFDAIHYSGMAIYKIGILLLNLVPFAALCLIP